MKLSIKGLPVIDEATFIKQIGDLDESISGSDSSESEDEEANGHAGDSTLTALLRRQARITEQEDDSFVVSKSKRGTGGAPILWLSSPKIGDDIGLGVYRAVLSDIEQQEAGQHLVDIIKRKQVAPIHSKQAGKVQAANGAVSKTTDPHFFLCMIGGGHFAAAVIGLAPEIRKGLGGIEERHAIVKAHKTFHRYTTRRKQGGSQSANDNAKGNAHSAGSSIRRYNEAALEADVRDILSQWKSMIDSAELLFVRATGTTNRRTLFGPYENQVLRTNDKRLRGFPFSTRRATQGELLRSFQELTRLKVNAFVEVPEDQPKSKPDTSQKTLKPKPETPKRSQEEEAALLHTSQLQNLIRRTKAPGVLLYLTKNSISPNFEFYPANEHHHAPTPLHLSASINSAALVTALLMKAKADPSVKNADGKTPYDIAGETKIRNLFRVARHELGEAAWDWSASHVPGAMAPEEAEAIARKEEAAVNAAEAERRKADLQRLEREEEQRSAGKIERRAGAGRALGAPVVEKTAQEKREEETRGLTPEMRMKLERERRARAAEARFKAMLGGK